MLIIMYFINLISSILFNDFPNRTREKATLDRRLSRRCLLSCLKEAGYNDQGILL